MRWNCTICDKISMSEEEAEGHLRDHFWEKEKTLVQYHKEHHEEEVIRIAHSVLFNPSITPFQRDAITSLIEFRAKGVSLDEHNELADFTKRLWAELYASDCPKKRFKELTNRLDEFFPSPGVVRRKELNTNKEGRAEAVSHVKRLGHQENIAKEKTDDVLAKSPALKINKRRGVT